MNLNNNSKTLKLIFLISISFITMFHRLNESPLGYDDTHYAQRAKEMLNRKDYFYTYPTFSKQIPIDKFILRKFFLGLSTFLVILWTLFPIIPKTLDSNEYKELQKSFEEIKKINKEIITLSNGELLAL